MPDSYRKLLAVVFSGQNICSSMLPVSNYLEFNRALICGVPLGPSPEKQAFLDTGLIHLMVVSGSHLVFWEQLLFFIPRRLQLGILAGYCFMTGFQPPVILAFVRRVISPRTFDRWGLTPLQSEAAVVAVCLILVPPWIFSRSFQMSWVCGIALSFSRIDPSLKIFALLFPFCGSAPVTILWNLILAPIVGLLLFPVCILSVPVKWARPVADEFWRIFLQVLASGPQSPALFFFLPTKGLWLWPLLIHGSFIYGEIRWRRASAFSVS